MNYSNKNFKKLLQNFQNPFRASQVSHLFNKTTSIKMQIYLLTFNIINLKIFKETKRKYIYKKVVSMLFQSMFQQIKKKIQKIFDFIVIFTLLFFFLKNQ